MPPTDIWNLLKVPLDRKATGLGGREYPSCAEPNIAYYLVKHALDPGAALSGPAAQNAIDHAKAAITYLDTARAAASLTAPIQAPLKDSLLKFFLRQRDLDSFRRACTPDPEHDSRPTSHFFTWLRTYLALPDTIPFSDIAPWYVLHTDDGPLGHDSRPSLRPGA